MKNLTLLKMKNLHNCLSFRHVICGLAICLTFKVSAVETSKLLLSRNPAAVDEEVLTVPLTTNDSFFTNANMFSDDDSGVMRDMKDSMSSWEKTEEYAKLWDLQSTGLYNTPSTTQKKNYISKRLLKYADKRLSGEMKNASEGTTLYKMKTVERNLRPNATVNVTKNFGFKFKARVLQGKAIVEVKNPWIECNATLTASGKAKVITRKEFKELGLASGAEYSVNDSQFLTYIDQQLTDNIKARVSNTAGINDDSRAEITASFPFNL